MFILLLVGLISESVTITLDKVDSVMVLGVVPFCVESVPFLFGVNSGLGCSDSVAVANSVLSFVFSLIVVFSS